MRILHLEASPGWGGQEIRILRESIGMKGRGHEVVLAVMRGAELGKRGKSAGLEVYELNFNRPGWLAAFFQLCRIIKKHQIDLINTHSSLDSWIGGLAGRWMGKKIVRTRHLSTPIKAGWNSRVLYGNLADYVVTTCASIVGVISRQSRKPPELCCSVPTGIDGSAIIVKPGEAEQFRAQYGISEKEFLVGTACFMRSWKGIQDLLQAAHRLRQVKNLRWVIIGGGHVATYQKMAKELELDILFTGHLDNPFPALAALDLFALLSTAHEGVSQAILQAAWLGKPLVATPTGGLGEVCIDRVTGIQVAPFSPEQVADAVLEMKENRTLCQDFGQNAKSWVEERFAWDSTLDRMEEIFKKMES